MLCVSISQDILFSNTQIQCFGEYKNGSSYRNIESQQISFLPYCRLLIHNWKRLLLISVYYIWSHVKGGSSVLSKNRRKVFLKQALYTSKLLYITVACLSHMNIIVTYVLWFFWLEIYQAMLIYIYNYSDFVSWWSQDSREMARGGVVV